MIRKLSELLVPGYAAGILDCATSPRSPLDLKMQSPRGLRNYDLGGVGLGIVAALEKSSPCDGGCGILEKHTLCSPGFNRSDPIPIGHGKNSGGGFFRGIGEEEEDAGSSENYTYVTCRGPSGKSCTRVYYSGAEREASSNRGGGFHGCNSLWVFHESPERSEDVSEFPTSDFLSFCHLCRKKLHGRDIYMYRGEKGFCSAECRSSQIMMDERKEICRSEASRVRDVASSPYSWDQIFSTGILAI